MRVDETERRQAGSEERNYVTDDAPNMPKEPAGMHQAHSDSHGSFI